jgi:hypothetical protein
LQQLKAITHCFLAFNSASKAQGAERMTDELKFGSADFYRLTGADNCRLRLMEADGTLSPVKTKSGWRIFSDSDVKKARKWLAENTHERRSA